MQRGIEVETGGQTYIVTTFPAFKGLTYLQKILKIVGPSVAQVFSAADLEKGELSEISIEDEALASAISSLTENLDKDNTAQLVQSMIKDSVTKGGQPVVFDQEFSGNFSPLVKLLGVIIKENYSSFFEESGFGGLASLFPQPQSKDE